MLNRNVVLPIFVVVVEFVDVVDEFVALQQEFSLLDSMPVEQRPFDDEERRHCY